MCWVVCVFCCGEVGVVILDGCVYFLVFCFRGGGFFLCLLGYGLCGLIFFSLVITLGLFC